MIALLYNRASQSSTRQEKAALAKVIVPSIREGFGELKNELVEKETELNGYESAIAQAEQHLEELGRYYDSVERGDKKRLKVDTA